MIIYKLIYFAKHSKDRVEKKWKGYRKQFAVLGLGIHKALEPFEF